MAQLPKGVRERMAATQGRGMSAHPDADALNAFVEDALLDAERERIIEHLSLCADCRDVVALSLPQEAVSGTAAPVTVQTTSRQVRWNIFRWASVAAAAVVVSAAVLLYQSKNAREPAQHPVDTVAAPATAPLPQTSKKDDIAEEAPAPQIQGTASDKNKGGSPAPRTGTAALAKQAPVAPPSAARETVELSAQSPVVTTDEAKPFAVAAEQSRQSVIGGVVGPGTNFEANAPRANRKVAGGNQTQNMQNQAAAAQLPQPAAAPIAQRADKGEAFGDYKAESNTARRESYNNSAGKTPGSAAMDSNAEVSTNSVVSKAVPRDRLQREGPAQAESTAELRSLTVESASPALSKTTAVNWRISDAGIVERSARDGTWQSALPARDIRFRAIATAGPEVWAGGSNGALYHSTNAGNSWTRISVVANGQMIAGDVVHIEVRTSRDLEITTSTGQRWTTRDGGSTWNIR